MSRFSVEDIRGLVPPIATPIRKDETVDEKGMRRLVNFQIEQGAQCLFVMGGTGEFYCFPDQEKTQAIEIAVDEARDRVPVIAGITDLSTRRAITNAHAAQEAGADFLVSLPPFFFSMRQDWIIEFYTAVAEETDLPLMLYTIGAPIHTNIQPATARRLSERPDIVGMKDSEGFAHVQEAVFLTQESDFRILTGLETDFFASLRIGAVGGVLSAGNICPRLCANIYDRTVAGDHEQAIELQKKLNRLVGELGALTGGTTSWWGIIKTGLQILGICSNTVTHPMPTCSDEEKQALEAIMKRYELL